MGTIHNLMTTLPTYEKPIGLTTGKCMQITFWHLLVLFAASKFECKPNDKHENVTSNEQNTGKPEFALKKVDVVARVRGKRSMHFQQEKCSRMRG